MKLRHSLSIFGLVAMLGLGVGVGLASRNAPAQEAKATYDGSVIIQKNDDDMKYTGSKLVAYFFDSSSHTGWGSAVANTGNKYQEYSWSLTFDPETIVVLRVNGTEWDSNDPWNNIWCRTGNVTLSGVDVVWMNGNAAEGSGWGTYALDAVVKGGATNDWEGEPTVNTALTGVKTNGTKLEAYGSVALPANSYFKVVKETSHWYGAYTAHSSISSNLSGGGANNIHNTAAATYEFYFDYDNLTTYITDPVLAAADEWAQTFLSGGCATTKTNWSTYATSYASLSSDSKALFTAVTSGGNEEGSYIEQAVARYDLVEVRYGKTAYTEFMGRELAGKLTPKATDNSIQNIINESNSLPIIILLASVASVMLLGGYFYIRKRKENN